MKKIYISLLILFFVTSPVLAQNNLSDWETVLDGAAGSDGAGFDTDEYQVEPIIATIIQTILSFLGVIFLVLMIWGGFLWMTARGNQDQVSKAKDMMTNAIIGLIIVVAAYAISLFVVEALTDTTIDI